MIRLAVLVLAGLLPLGLALPARGAPKPPRAVVILPFDATALEREEQWIGEGVAQLLSLGLAQHPGFVQIPRSRLRSIGAPGAWGDAGALQALRSAHAHVALYGRLERRDGQLIVLPRALEMKGDSSPEPLTVEPLPAPEGELLERLAGLPATYARALRVAVTDAEAGRMERAAHPTRSQRAFELYARGQSVSLRGGQQENEAAVDLLARAIEADAQFVVAHYALGVIHQALGNRWKAAAQFRASTQLDAAYPEPFKALGDQFMSAPRRLFDQAVEAYSKAIELRPFYAEAHVGLGDAKAAKGDVDGAVAAYQKALVYNPVNPRVHLSLGKIYYAEKGLYYESVNAYKRAIELDANSLDARMGLGEVYEDKGLYKEAIGEYAKVLELDARHTGAMYNLALVFEKVDPKEAIARWERYIQVASQLPAEKDWVDVARQHLRKLKSQVKE